MPNIKFMLVCENLVAYIVSTPFTKVSELREWLDTIAGNAKFVCDPIAHLPPRSFANLLITEDEENDIAPVKNFAKIEHSSTWKDCHGTLLVDDNDSVFYWVRDKNECGEWTLPAMLKQGV